MIVDGERVENDLVICVAAADDDGPALTLRFSAATKAVGRYSDAEWLQVFSQLKEAVESLALDNDVDYDHLVWWCER